MPPLAAPGVYLEKWRVEGPEPEPDTREARPPFDPEGPLKTHSSPKRGEGRCLLVPPPPQPLEQG